jgi:hypothetical protein
MFVSEIFAEIEKGNYLLKTFRTGDVWRDIFEISRHFYLMNIWSH